MRKKVIELFYKTPVVITVAIDCMLSLLISVIFCIVDANFYIDAILGMALIFSILIIPVLLTVENIIFLFSKPKSKKKETAVMQIEAVTVILGAILSCIYAEFCEITSHDWHVQLSNNQTHTPISSEHLLTIIIFMLLMAVGYGVLRYIPLKHQTPLITVIAIGFMYIGAVVQVLWCVQINDLLLWILPFNCIVIMLRTIRNIVWQKNQLTKERREGEKLKGLSKILDKASALPIWGLVAALPVLGITVALLTLFGQEPDSIIKAWTETADWTMSQKIAPQNIYYDEHYLCTVAAGGHKKAVKPIRTGIRHGHKVIVNRQLCIANAFEQLLEEKTPRVHRAVRGFYDKYGYPIAKHIHSAYIADIIYFLMKPLEWFFLAVLYLFDTEPENRIAVQYPHKPLPKAL